MKGGNTDEVYEDRDRFEFAESLRQQHPDVVTIVERYGRYHHDVDYTPFQKNQLRWRKGIHVEPGVNEYGMKLVEEP